MRIAIDATPAMKAHRTGVARYVHNLARSLAAEAGPGHEYVLCYRLSRFSRRRHRLALPGPGWRSAWMQGRFHPRGQDLAHGPDGRLLPFPGAKQVVTLHDVFSLQSDEFGTEAFRRKMAARYAEVAARADRIICISSWTRDRFWEFHPDVPEDRFVVIPGGVEERFRPEASASLPALRGRLGIEGPYVLVLGEISRRKNVSRILDAFVGVPGDAAMLVLAGRPSYGHEDIAAEVERRGLRRRVLLTGYFPEDDLPTLIAGAQCLLLASLMEGFGLTVLEAQACGTPVVCSDRGALAETSGGIRVKIDPEDPESIAEGVRKILGDARLRGDLSAKGIEWAAGYRWSGVARRTLAVYHEVDG